MAFGWQTELIEETRHLPSYNCVTGPRIRCASKFFVSFVRFAVNFTAVLMTEERKTLEQREQMTDLERLRHSASHVLPLCHSERRGSEVEESLDLCLKNEKPWKNAHR